MAVLSIVILIVLWNAQTNGFSLHKQYGPSAIARMNSFSGIRKSIIPNPKGVFTGRGRIVYWTFYARNTGTIYLQVWRKQSRNIYKLISSDAHEITGRGKTTIQARSSRTFVADGDVIGFYTEELNLIPYDNVPCNDGLSPTVAVSSAYSRVYVGRIQNFRQISWSRNSCRVYSLNVLVETNVKLTGGQDQAYGFDSIYRMYLGYRRKYAHIPNVKDEVVKDGQLVKWQFYAKRKGKIYLQIWNHTTQHSFRLLYQTMHEVKTVGLNIVTASEPVLIRKGSVMGFYNQARSIIPYTTYMCHSKVTWTTYRGYMSINSTYSFSNPSSCRKYSIWMQLTKENERIREFGFPAVSRFYKDLHTNRVLIPQPHQPLPNGRLLAWEMYAATPGEVYLQIWRPVSNDPLTRYRLIREDGVHATGSGVIKISVSALTILTKGDAIGIYFKKDNIIPFSGIACSKPEFLYVKEPRNLRVNGYQPFSEKDVIWNKCRAYSVKVKVVEFGGSSNINKTGQVTTETTPANDVTFGGF